MPRIKSLYYTVFLVLCLSIQVALADDLPIKITNVWISEAPPAVSPLAAYASLQNQSSYEMTLVAVSSPDFSNIEIHLSLVADGMARMEKQPAMTIPAEATIELSPGGYHLMLFNPGKQFVAGDKAMLVFTFADGSAVSIEASVMKRNTAHQHKHHHPE
jgi:copper(I)-binding protein